MTIHRVDVFVLESIEELVVLIPQPAINNDAEGNLQQSEQSGVGLMHVILKSSLIRRLHVNCTSFSCSAHAS